MNDIRTCAYRQWLLLSRFGRPGRTADCNFADPHGCAAFAAASSSNQIAQSGHVRALCCSIGASQAWTVRSAQGRFVFFAMNSATPVCVSPRRVRRANSFSRLVMIPTIRTCALMIPSQLAAGNDAGQRPVRLLERLSADTRGKRRPSGIFDTGGITPFTMGNAPSMLQRSRSWVGISRSFAIASLISVARRGSALKTARTVEARPCDTAKTALSSGLLFWPSC